MPGGAPKRDARGAGPENPRRVQSPPMSELEIGPQLIGAKVQNAARPDWGTGTVTRVQRTVAGGKPVHRVTIHFAMGIRHVRVPPGRLIAPRPEPTRAAGWLDSLGGGSLDQKLRRLPQEAVTVLGTPRQRLEALLPLFAWNDSPGSLERWARQQSGVGDPLSHWTRDELLAAFSAFRSERDAALRAAAARLKLAEGQAALRDCLDRVPADMRAAVREALERPL